MVRILDFCCCSMASFLQNRTIGRRKVPAYAVFLSLCAATGGLMFGYDIGISGGVTLMDDFLCQFFPSVLEKKIKEQGEEKTITCAHISTQDLQKDNEEHKVATRKTLLYCMFHDQRVQLFTSSLYLAAMVATVLAAYVSRKKGRKITIILSTIFYFVGTVLNISCGSISNRHHASFAMLILGRIMLGFGLGFGNQAIPLFISEIAPADARGSLNYLFQLNITIGILFANLVNWKAQRLHTWGWRLSLGLAGIPTLLFAIGSLFLVETPSSCVQRGLLQQAKDVLSSIRGEGVDTNLALQDIVAACNKNPRGSDIITKVDPLNYCMNTRRPSSIKSSKKYFNGLFARSNIPPLIITIFVQFFQQFSGINLVMFYAPILFKTFGSSTNKSLLYVSIIGSVNVVSTMFSILAIDRIGRRRLLLIASILMAFTQFFIGLIMIGTSHKDHLEKWRAVVVLMLICVFVSAFEFSWGPLGWLISTEIFPLACRSEGQSIAVFFNMLFTFVIAHTSLSMFCTMTFGIFFFFASWATIMGFCSFLFLPETMNMDIEIIYFIWSYHKVWKRFVTPPTSPSAYRYPPLSSPHLENCKSNTGTLSQQDSLRFEIQGSND